VRTSSVGGEVRVEITDTGEGIPAQILAKIWDVYFSSKKTGTGMGLPTARRIVEEHGGLITAVNRDGGGLRVTIRLPGAASSAPPSPT